MKMMKKFLTRVLSTTILTAKDYERKLCSMNFKIGETFKIKDVELLTLDIIDGNPFVIALDTGIESKFAEDSNNYDGSTLEDVVDEWFEELGVPAFSRVLDLTTMDGSKCYGALEVEAAPLTFDEFRKYAEIIIPNIKHWFWLATGWADPKWKNWGSGSVCYVNGDGSADYTYYVTAGGRVAPAFILDKKFFENIQPHYGNKPDPQMLAGFTTDELLAEVSRRVKGA